MSATFWNMRRRAAAQRAQQEQTAEKPVEATEEQTAEKPVEKPKRGRVKKDDV